MSIIYGDGSVGYTLAKFDSFVRHRLPVVGLVGNDTGWSQIAREQVKMSVIRSRPRWPIEATSARGRSRFDAEQLSQVTDNDTFL